MFHWNQIWRRMRQLTDKEIEKKAIAEIIKYFQPQIDAVIIQSLEELKKLNKLKEIQGLYPKERIDEECIKNAINYIKSEGNTVLPKGGEKQKIGEKNVSHTPKERKIQGVEIT